MENDIAVHPKNIDTLKDTDLDEEKLLVSEAEKMIKLKKKLEEDSSFFATFIDGSTFKYMIEYIRLINMEGVFRFEKDAIYYEQMDQYGYICNKIKIKTYELVDYDFSSELDSIIVGVNLSELRNVCRNIGKKDHVDLYKLQGEPEHLYIRIRSQSEKDSQSNIYRVQTTVMDYDRYELKFTKSKKDPTCTVYQTDFSKLCKSVVIIKCVHVIAHGFKNGVIFKGILNGGPIGSVKEFGKCYPEESSGPKLKSFDINSISGKSVIKSKKPAPKINIKEIGEIEKFKIDISVIKFMQKLNGLSPSGTLKIYVEEGCPLKMICNIGTFGKLEIYLFDTDV